MQIRTRLTWQFVIITAAIFTIALFFIYSQFREHSENEFFAVLESKARMTADMVLKHEQELVKIASATSNGTESALPFEENITIYNQYFDRVFAINLTATPLAERQLAALWKAGSMRFSNQKYQAFGAAVTSSSGNNYVVVAEGIFDDKKLMKLRNIMFLAFFLIVGIAGAGGWFFAGQALSPVSRIVNEVDGMLPSDLSRRLQQHNQHDELSRMVATVNRLLDRIEHAFRMQRSFISNVSHELKNPLAAMDAQLQVARQKDRSTVEYREVLASLHDDVHEITDTAEKLLQLAKVHSEAATIAFSNVRLDEIMLQTRDSFLKLHPDYAIVFEIQNMPEQEEKLCIVGNEPLLRTALSNLFDNGCKFSPDNRVHVTIRFQNSGNHEVVISDNGPGISPEDLQKIFEPFFRSPQLSGFKGSGIGLSLVQSILKLHGVVIDVLSESKKGASFRLKFPVIDPAMQ